MTDEQERLEDRANYLRTQALEVCMRACGAAEVHGSDYAATGGVIITSDRTFTSRTYWREPDGRWKYDVDVTVTVTRRKVGD